MIGQRVKLKNIEFEGIDSVVIEFDESREVYRLQSDVPCYEFGIDSSEPFWCWAKRRSFELI